MPQEPNFYSEHLGSSQPGVRRLAARALGRTGDSEALPLLREAMEGERCLFPALELSAAWIRCGGDWARSDWALKQPLRPLQTARGWRVPSAMVDLGFDALQRERARSLWGRIDASSSEPIPSIDELSAALRAEVHRDISSVRGRASLEALSCLGLIEDRSLLLDLLPRVGRRTHHIVLIAMGRHGHPDLLEPLFEHMDRMDVDPGRGFAQRRIVAMAMGRFGLPGLAPHLARALRVEAENYEGKPGAGLGIQYPVRNNMLWALGELQAPESAPLLAGYLSNLHGSALGGFHLPAMSALTKLAPGVVLPALEPILDRDDPDAVRNALGVLRDLKQAEAIRQYSRRGGPESELAAPFLSGAPPQG